MELSEFCGIRRKKSVTPFNFEDASDFSDADISSVHASSAPIGPRGVRPAKSGKTRRLVRNRDGTFMGSPGNSDPDEIIYASEAQIISRSVSPRSGLINPGKGSIIIMAGMCGRVLSGLTCLCAGGSVVLASATGMKTCPAAQDGQVLKIV